MTFTKRTIVTIGVIAALVCMCCLMGCSSKSTSTKKSSSSTQTNCVTEATGEYASGIHHATVKVKGYDTFTIELNADEAPVSVWNFCTLAEQGAYTNATFHRIVESFCLQGGDPTGTGTGSGSYTILGEFSQNNVANKLADNYKKGTVAWARSSNANSASLQWFITLSDSAASSLNGLYAAFGTISASDMAIVDKIVKDYLPKATGNSGTISSKSDQPVIESVTITD